MVKEQQNTYQNSASEGFTLIELLMVISIMSMLMSIMLPGLSRAREQAKRLVCSSNLRQMTIGWSFYAMDNQDRLCSPKTDWDSPGNWVTDGPPWPSNNTGNTKMAIENGSLFRYMQTVDIYKCKSDPSEFLRSYSIAADMTGTIDQISRPFSKIVFVDAGSNWRWIHNGFSPICENPLNIKWQPWDLRYLQQITARHSGGCNVFFADFHCEHWRWRNARTIDFANQQIDADEASYNNADLENLAKLLKGNLY